MTTQADISNAVTFGIIKAVVILSLVAGILYLIWQYPMDTVIGISVLAVALVCWILFVIIRILTGQAIRAIRDAGIRAYRWIRHPILDKTSLIILALLGGLFGIFWLLARYWPA